MLFSLLGSLEISAGDRPIELRAPKQRALLALLLLRRGEPVPVERIADQLWAGEPPATGTKAVRVYVGELRKALGADVIVTRGAGYALPLDGHQTDIARFEELASAGRARLEQGDAEGAAAVLREALGLWRGAALADFRYDDFAQPEIARLEEARLTALEARIDADLGLGRDSELVPELHALVGEHPLRERLRGQLMLALYRTGRQAEALDVYREGRRRLVDELGLEPSRDLQELERAILAQDESIGAPPRRPPLRRVRRRSALVIGVGGLLVVAAAAAALAISLSRSGRGAISSTLQGNTLAEIDPASGKVVGEVPVGATPSAVAVGGGAAWVLNADDQTISRVDTETKAVRTFGIGATPTDLAAGAGGVWVGNGGKQARAQFAGTVAVAVTRLETHTGAVVANVALPRTGPLQSNLAQRHIALAAGSVWAIAPDYSLVRIDPERNAVTAVVRGLTAVAVAAGRDGLWVLTDRGTLARIVPRGNRVTARVNVPATGLSDLAVGDSSVWATDPYQGTVWRIDPGSQAAGRTIDVGAGADSVSFGAGAVWVANSLQGTLSRIDPGTNKVTRVVPLGATPRAVAVGDGRVWVAVAGEATAAAGPQSGQTVAALPATICGPLLSGSDAAKFIVVSDLPLRGGPRFVTPEMAAAELYVLRSHAFRAGRYPLAFQSCDHSTPQTGLYDDRKCASNTQAYVANPNVIGVVGPFNSGCAFSEIPIASRAGLPVVSPTNSVVALTRKAFDAPRGALASLYPTGHRTYVHLMSPDDAQAAAGAVLARQLGAAKVFVVDDGGYGTSAAYYFTRAAGRLGLRIAGAAHWDPQKPRFSQIASRARASGAQAVFLCGLVDDGGGELLSALRRSLSPSVSVIGCDGLLPVSLLFEHAGQAARGTYITLEGVVNERLAAAGQRFLREFGATQPGKRVDIAAVYAAQATELLLAAIARSDGTRASVSAELFKTRVRDGLIGDFAINATGDPVPAPITILRLQHGGGANAVMSYAGARIDRVLTPPARLTGGG